MSNCSLYLCLSLFLFHHFRSFTPVLLHSHSHTLISQSHTPRFLALSSIRTSHKILLLLLCVTHNICYWCCYIRRKRNEVYNINFASDLKNESSKFSLNLICQNNENEPIHFKLSKKVSKTSTYNHFNRQQKLTKNSIFSLALY